MPTFEFTSPAGSRYVVNGPPGATKEQAFQILQQQIMMGKAQGADPQLEGVPSIADTIPKAPKAPEPAVPLVDRIGGIGEAALTMASGATTGAVGMLGGAVKGLAGAVMDGTFGTQEGVRQVEQNAAAGMELGTYSPRTPQGQEMAQSLGELGAAAMPLAGMSAQMNAATRAAGQAGQAARNTVPVAGAVVAGQKVSQAAANTVTRIRESAPLIAERLERTLRRNPDRTPTPGTRASGGAAGTDMADQRVTNAQSLPVPLDLTEGQATRNPDQLRFELETAKGAEGAPLRNRYAEQNERIQKNFDAWVDMTGAEMPDLRSAGKAVDNAVREKAARDKAQIRVAYKEAEKAGELEAPVTLDSLVDHLNESAPDAATAPILNTARARAIQLGIAAEGEGGQLIATPTTLRNAERMRQAVNRATDFEPTNIRQSAIIKSAIDTQTDGLGGGKYRAARRLRENFARQYENRAVIHDLLRTSKNGMADRKVAFEDVFDNMILKSDLDDVRHVRRVLQTGGEEGSQAWRELQGRTAQWLKDEATKNVATDERGNRIFSAAQLDKAIRKLDHDGKLDFIFGKKGAEQMRDINDLAKVVFTAPPGTVNTSNTASVLMAALAEAGVTGSMVGLPVPVVSGMRLIAKHVKDKKLRARIEQALNAPQRRRATPNF